MLQGMMVRSPDLRVQLVNGRFFAALWRNRHQPAHFD
jgi:hypothetical protein